MLPLPRVQVPEGLLPTGQSSEPAPEQKRTEPVEQKPDPQREAQRMQVLQSLMEGLTGRYEFGLLKESGQFFVKVIDRSTNQVIETRPFKEYLQAKERIATSVGMFLDENV